MYEFRFTILLTESVFRSAANTRSTESYGKRDSTSGAAFAVDGRGQNTLLSSGGLQRRR